MEKKLRSIMRNTYMKHVWNMFELQHARVYIYTLLHDRVLQGWGITCHPKSIVRNVCRRQILFLKVIQQGDLAMPRWLIFRLPATRFSSGPSFPKTGQIWMERVKKSLKFLGKWVEHDIILFVHTPKKIRKMAEPSCKWPTWRNFNHSTTYYVAVCGL